MTTNELTKHHPEPEHADQKPSPSDSGRKPYLKPDVSPPKSVGEVTLAGGSTGGAVGNTDFTDNAD